MFPVSDLILKIKIKFVFSSKKYKIIIIMTTIKKLNNIKEIKEYIYVSVVTARTRPQKASQYKRKTCMYNLEYKIEHILQM